MPPIATPPGIAQPRGSNRRPALARGLVILAGALASASVAACASAEPYNPSNLGAEPLSRVSAICQSTLGLSPKEAPIWGPGDPRLTPGENHFQGCVASLSDTLQRISVSQQTLQTDQDCQAKGFRPGSPELAHCVLGAMDGAERISTTLASAPASAPALGHFEFAAGGEITRRERQACADLGLSPAYPAFEGCVKDLSDTFYAIDNPNN